MERRIGTEGAREKRFGERRLRRLCGRSVCVCCVFLYAFVTRFVMRCRLGTRRTGTQVRELFRVRCQKMLVRVCVLLCLCRVCGADPMIGSMRASSLPRA